MNPIYAGLPTTVFEEMSMLARQGGAINLGQGFPDGDGPEDVRQAAADAFFTRSNQYPPMAACRNCARRWRRITASIRALPSTATTFLSPRARPRRSLPACSP